mmetsp:Transcript_2962/g.8302  ORF Transcript_2962/g.8302 Transcript_2962/m.8302 type:complete len:86 (+) Transcript_2962:206-463(+)
MQTSTLGSGDHGMSAAAPGQAFPRRRSSGKTSHSRSYPRGVGLDFRRLAGLTLVHYIDHHGACVRLSSTQQRYTIVSSSLLVVFV